MKLCDKEKIFAANFFKRVMETAFDIKLGISIVTCTCILPMIMHFVLVFHTCCTQVNIFRVSNYDWRSPRGIHREISKPRTSGNVDYVDVKRGMAVIHLFVCKVRNHSGFCDTTVRRWLFQDSRSHVTYRDVKINLPMLKSTTEMTVRNIFPDISVSDLFIHIPSKLSRVCTYFKDNGYCV